MRDVVLVSSEVNGEARVEAAVKISILTLFPRLFDAFLATSIIKRAVDQGLVEFYVYNLLETVAAKVRVDAPTVGPGPGMVIKPEVLAKGIAAAEEHFGPGLRIFFSPQGQPLTQLLLRDFVAQYLPFLAAEATQALQGEFAQTSQDPNSQLPPSKQAADSKHFILVCLRYEGADHRAEEEFADLFISIGDYILMGGELAAQVFLEAFLRLLPNVLGNASSSTADSFETPFFDYPNYCKPDVWNKREIPPILFSGDHAQINAWRLGQAVAKTVTKRFDWFSKHPHASEFAELALAQIPPHYCVIMHDQVLNKEGLVGTTSIKSMDLHDISRSCASFGIKKFFVVQPLGDQQAIVREFFSFWTSEAGQNYNSTRHDAVAKIDLCDSLAQVVAKITTAEGAAPLVVATSAQKHLQHETKTISYHDQQKVWRLARPVLIVFGTGYGLAPQIIENCDFLLLPVHGLVDYNHLSVRAAAAIVLDRWLGLSPCDNRDLLIAKK